MQQRSSCCPARSRLFNSVLRRQTWGPVAHTPRPRRIRGEGEMAEGNEEKEEILKLLRGWEEKETSPIVKRALADESTEEESNQENGEEKKETRGMKWADCEDDEGEKNKEEQEAERKQEQEQEGDREKEAEERRAQEAREEERRSAGGARGREQSAGGARGREKSAGGARGSEENTGGTRREEERRKRENRERAQEGHDGEEEMTTQETCVEAKKEMNSMYEESDVSNRHTTWWRNAWWVRVDNGPHLRTARGRRRAWRAATRAAREARETEQVAGGEREKWEQGTTGRKESNTLHVVFHFPSNGNVTATATRATTTAAATAAAPAAAPQCVRLQ